MFAPDDDVGPALVPVDDVEGKDNEGEMIVVPLVFCTGEETGVIDAGAEGEVLVLVYGPWNCDAGVNAVEGVSVVFSFWMEAVFLCSIFTSLLARSF